MTSSILSQTRPPYRLRRQLSSYHALRWSLRRDLWRAVLPRKLCRGRDVLMEDVAVAVDTRQVSAASENTEGIRICPDDCAYVGCSASDRRRGCSAETSRLLLHGLTPSGEHVSIRPAWILQMLASAEWKWPVEILRPI